MEDDDGYGELVVDMDHTSVIRSPNDISHADDVMDVELQSVLAASLREKSEQENRAFKRMRAVSYLVYVMARAGMEIVGALYVHAVSCADSGHRAVTG